MNYQAIYDNLILKARTRIFEDGIYFELHHIVPRCLGGTDGESNLAKLTAEEHYVAHQLLVKLHPGNTRLIYAVRCMAVGGNGKRVNNKLYGWLRKPVKHSEETIEKIRASNLGKKRSDEARKNISEAKKGCVSPRKGVTVSEESRLKMSLAKKGKKRGPSPLKGRKMSDETKRKMSESQKARFNHDI